MQTRLLSLLYDLPHQHTPLSGLWLIHTDDSLVVDWLIDACRHHWSRHHQVVKRMELTSAKSWHEVMNELSSLSLFDEHTALIITGKHKIDTKDKALMSALTRFADDVQKGNSQNHLIWCLPRQDKKSLTTKAIQFFDTHGLLIDGNIYDERLRGEFLHFYAEKLDLRLDQDAWQWLMQSTENNLLSAYQTLWRLTLLPHGATVSVDDLTMALVAGADFDVFDLSHALLTANAQKAMSILTHLKHTDTAPSVVLWAVAKEVRLILQIQSGKQVSELGIWQSKAHLYTHTADRMQGKSGDWLGQIYEIDKVIKGVSDVDLWGKIETLCLSVCGVGGLSFH